MNSYYTFTEDEKIKLSHTLNIQSSPYTNFSEFEHDVESILGHDNLQILDKLCKKINNDRKDGIFVHLLSNCPIDVNLVLLGNTNPRAVKLATKKTFISEAFMLAFAKLLETPLLSYKNRNEGDFFTDVVAIDDLQGKQSGFTADDLIYHNDRTGHPVRADFISLLGLNYSNKNRVYTNYIDINDIVVNLSQNDINLLSENAYITEMDDLTKSKNHLFLQSETHSILMNNRIRYQDTLTTVSPDIIDSAKYYKAIISLKNAITRSNKSRVEINVADMLVFPNQRGLHNRDIMEKNDLKLMKTRWLLKTYTFKDNQQALNHKIYFKNNALGCANDEVI